MVAPHTNQLDARNVSFPQTPLATDIQPVANHAHASESDEPDASGHKLRNRLILVNAVAWVAIIVAVRMIFF